MTSHQEPELDLNLLGTMSSEDMDISSYLDMGMFENLSPTTQSFPTNSPFSLGVSPNLLPSSSGHSPFSFGENEGHSPGDSTSSHQGLSPHSVDIPSPTSIGGFAYPMLGGDATTGINNKNHQNSLNSNINGNDTSNLNGNLNNNVSALASSSTAGYNSLNATWMGLSKDEKLEMSGLLGLGGNGNNLSGNGSGNIAEDLFGSSMGGINPHDISSPFSNNLNEMFGMGVKNGLGAPGNMQGQMQLPLSPPYDPSSLSSGGMRSSGNDNEDEEEDEEEEEEEEQQQDGDNMDQSNNEGLIRIKDEPVSPVLGASQPVDQFNNAQQQGFNQPQADPFGMLGLTAEQQQALLQSLLATYGNGMGQPQQQQAQQAGSSTFNNDNITSIRKTSVTTTPDRDRDAHSAGPSSLRSASTAPPTGPTDPDAALPPLPALFGGLKGKGGKKGGGMSSVVREEDEEVGEDEDWRPTPEQYKKLSSKEKRQLRNKLSARAFRNRRKDYISELEDHIKDRDRLIDAIRVELKSARGERDELRQEINALKKAAMIATPESLQQPRPSAAVAGVSSHASTSQPTKREPSPLNMFNPNKDMPSSTASLAALGSMSPTSIRGFWGAGLNDTPINNFFGGGGYTPVHTALTPDLTLPSSLAGKAGFHHQPTPRATRPTAPPQMNINPLLNGPTARVGVPVYNHRADGTTLGSDGFEAWVEKNDFNHKSLDAYRNQVYSRMVKDNALAKAGVPQEMRPKFLRDPTSEPAASIKQEDKEAVVQVVQSALTSRLFNAFVAAFQNPARDGLDATKVSAVFSGHSKLSVVPSAPSTPPNEKESSSSSSTSALDAEKALEKSFASLRVGEGMGEKFNTPAPTPKRQEICVPAAVGGVFSAISRDRAMQCSR